MLPSINWGNRLIPSFPVSKEPAAHFALIFIPSESVSLNQQVGLWKPRISVLFMKGQIVASLESSQNVRFSHRNKPDLLIQRLEIKSKCDQ